MLRTREILGVHIRISSWPSQSSSQQWRLPFIPQFRSRSQTCMRAGPAPQWVRVFKKISTSPVFKSWFVLILLYLYILHILPDVYRNLLSELPGFGARCGSSAHPPAVAVPPPWRDEGHPPECLTRNQKKHCRIVFKLQVGLFVLPVYRSSESWAFWTDQRWNFERKGKVLEAWQLRLKLEMSWKCLHVKQCAWIPWIEHQWHVSREASFIW